MPTPDPAESIRVSPFGSVDPGSPAVGKSTSVGEMQMVSEMRFQEFIPGLEEATWHKILRGCSPKELFSQSLGPQGGELPKGQLGVPLPPPHHTTPPQHPQHVEGRSCSAHLQ